MTKQERRRDSRVGRQLTVTSLYGADAGLASFTGILTVW
jgi:hypothetical protein